MVHISENNHFYDLVNVPLYDNLETIGYHLHTARHGKSVVDGHFSFVSSAVSDYSTDNESGVQTSEDVCIAINTASQHRIHGASSNIEYIPINLI